jgi:drug/metabolite transporter (DMT)-like permease
MRSSDYTVNMAENIPAGIAWMLFAMFWFVALDTAAKYLMQYYPVVQVVWGRFFFHVVFVLLMMGSQVKSRVRSKNWQLQLLRSFTMLITTALFFSGIHQIQLATASTIMFLSPILVTVLAIPLLGETVGFRRWVGVAMGLLGAVIIMRPGTVSFNSGMVFLLAAATSHAFYQIATRKVRVFDGPMTSLFYTGLVGTLVTTLLLPVLWTSVKPIHWLLFIVLGFAGAVGHLCFIRAFSIAPASVVSPLSYTTLIWTTLS